MIIQENLTEKINNSESVAKIMIPIFLSRPEEEKHKEYLYTMGLDSQNRIKIIDLSGIGTINQCTLYIREILRIAIIKNCTSIIIIHNHPSGCLEPSQEDKKFTKNLKTACEYVELNLLDSIIVNDNSHYSLSNNGLI